MCFNAVKNWQLGWYADRHITLNQTESGSLNYEGNLIGLSDYGSTTSADKMIIYIPNAKGADFYVSYNRKSGINAGTLEGGNQVLVHEKLNVPHEQGLSWLLAKLNAGDSYELVVDGVSVPVSVKSINGLYAKVVIGEGNPETSVPSFLPSVEPTPSPTSNWLVSPLGNIQTHMDDNNITHIIALFKAHNTAHKVTVYESNCQDVITVFGEVATTTITGPDEMKIEVDLTLDLDVIQDSSVYTDNDDGTANLFFCLETALLYQGDDSFEIKVAKDRVLIDSTLIFED